MADDLPPDVAAARALVQQFVDNAKPGDIPSVAVQAAQARCQQWLDSQKPAAAQPRAELPFERFKRQHLVRSDSPPEMPAWKDPRPEVQGRWRNPRGAA